MIKNHLFVLILITLFFLELNIVKVDLAIDEVQYVSIWHFDENSGTIIYDETASNNDGTIYGASWTIGKEGGALFFDVGNYIEIADSPSLDLSPPFCIEAWIKISNPGLNTYYTIVDKGVHADSNYALVIDNQGRVICGFSVNHEHTIPNEHLTGITNVIDGKWHHVAFTYNGEELAIYVDYRLDVKIQYYGIPDTNNRSLTIGKRFGEYQNEFKGIIDEVRISHYAMLNFNDTNPPNINNINREPSSPSQKDQVTVLASISDITSGVKEVYLYFSKDSGTWNKLPMSLIENIKYEATIPRQNYGTLVEYFVAAFDNNLNPINSAKNSYIVKLSDTDPPIINNINHKPFSPTQEDLIAVTASVTDDISGIKEVYLYFSKDSETWSRLLMVNIGSSSYAATISKQIGGTTVEYYVVASDNYLNQENSAIISFAVTFSIIAWLIANLSTIMVLFIISTIGLVGTRWKIKKDRFERAQLAKGFIKYKGRWGTPDEVNAWKRQDEDAEVRKRHEEEARARKRYYEEAKGQREERKAEKLSASVADVLRVSRDASNYDILGVSSSASKEEVDEKYKVKIKEFHPDRYPPGGGYNLAQEVSKVLNIAKDEIYKEKGWQ